MNGRTNSTKDGDTIINGALIPLEQVTQFAIVPRDGAALLTWVDPIDKTATPGGEMVAEWDHTDIIRKINSAPTSINDGELAIRETVRNNYQTAGFTDDNLQNNQEYYYSAFAVSKYNVPNEPVSSSVIPVMATPEYVTTLYRKGFEQPGSTIVNWSRNVGISASANNILIAGGYRNGQYGGHDCEDVTCINSSLTQSTLQDVKFNNSYGNINGISTPSYHIFYMYPGIYSVFETSSLTQSGPYEYFGETSDDRNFSSGIEFNSNAYMTNGQENLTNHVYQLTDELSISIIGSLSNDRTDTHKAANINYMLFAGGHSPGSMQSSGQRDNVDAFNIDLTRINVTPLSSSRASMVKPNGAGTSVGQYLLFAGGLGNYDYGEDVVDAYDNNLTRMILPTLVDPNSSDRGWSKNNSQKCNTNALISTGSSLMIWYDPALTRSSFNCSYADRMNYIQAGTSMNNYSVYIEQYNHIYVFENR